jgi:hypothetical protein
VLASKLERDITQEQEKKKKEEKKMFDSVKSKKRSKVDHFHSAGKMINAFVQLYTSSIFFSFSSFSLLFHFFFGINREIPSENKQHGHSFSTVFLFYYVI